jgi:hypothetical protein
MVCVLTHAHFRWKGHIHSITFGADALSEVMTSEDSISYDVTQNCLARHSSPMALVLLTVLNLAVSRLAN